jgi:hypothetical protein
MVPLARVENRLVFRLQAQAVLKSPGFRAVGPAGDFAGRNQVVGFLCRMAYPPPGNIADLLPSVQPYSSRLGKMGKAW